MSYKEKQMANKKAPRKRPKWVWVISVFFFLSASWTLYSIYLVETGAVQLQPDQVAYFDNLTGIDYTVSIIIGLANLLGAVALFMLRAVSFYFFMAALLLNVILHIWHILNKGWADAVGGPGMIGALIGLIILVAVCSYTYSLKKHRILV